MRNIDAVFFDLGDTIVDLREGADDYVARLVGRAERVYDVVAPCCPDLPERIEFTELLARGTEDFYLAALARQQGVSIYDALRDIFSQIGLPTDEEFVRMAGDAYYRSGLPPAPLRIGAAEVLAALHVRGLRLGVISNTLQPGWAIDDTLARRGLIDLFAARIYSSEVRVAKPHAAIFRAALGALGVSADRALHVGDRPLADVAGAQGVGMRAVLIETPYRLDADSDVVADARICELPELLELLS